MMSIEEREVRKQQMRQHLAAWQQSHLSMQSYCDQTGISFHALYYWRKKFRQAENQVGEGFIPLSIKKRQDSTVPSIEIFYPNGVSVRLGEMTNLLFIGKLIRLV